VERSDSITLGTFYFYGQPKADKSRSEPLNFMAKVKRHAMIKTRSLCRSTRSENGEF